MARLMHFQESDSSNRRNDFNRIKSQYNSIKEQKMKTTCTWFDKLMMAVTFAEANDHITAHGLVNKSGRESNELKGHRQQQRVIRKARRVEANF